MIEVEDVVVERPGLAAPVLDGLSFKLAPGERAALLGGNGSGKTTLARLLNGTELPARGRVLVNGQDTRDAGARRGVRQHVGLLFQDPDDQFVSTTVEREIAFGPENLCVPVSELRAAVRAALGEFDLEAYRQAPPHEMSGGEKARVALACVWVMRPGVLVLDETDSLLDRRGCERLEAQIAALPAGTTLLRITTDAEVAAACPRLLVLHAGRLVADGAPGDVLGNLPEDVVERTGLPLVWRLSARLVASGRMQRPTSSWTALLAALGLQGAARGGAEPGSAEPGSPASGGAVPGIAEPGSPTPGGAAPGGAA